MTTRRDLFVATYLATAAAAVGAGVPSTASAQGDGRQSTVTLERLPAGVLAIGINRPSAGNLIDLSTFFALGRAYYELEHDDALRVAVLHAHGADFSPGLDPPSWIEGLRAGVFNGPIAEFINPVGTTRPYRSKPVVVAVHGLTQLLGHELFLAADVRVAARNTSFSQGEVLRGVFPGGGGTVRFTREAGWGNAMRYMLTGDQWGADEAYRLGLVQAVVPNGQQFDRAMVFAKKIAAAAPLGVRSVLASAHQALANEDAALAALLPEFGRLMQSEDRQEYRRAVRDNRAPAFRGR
jgi:enoyl-CoA hydratase/carnithine racemase